MQEFKFVLGAKLTIPHAETLPPILRAKLNKVGIHSNPDFARMKKMGFSTYKTPPKIFTQRILPRTAFGEVMQFERGLMGKVKEAILEYNMLMRDNRTPEYVARFKEIEDLTISIPVDWPEFKLELESYQEDVIDRVKARMSPHVNQGIISLPTGGGKTITASYLLGYLKQRTLIVVHTRALADQWYDSLTKTSFDNLDVSKLIGGVKGDISGKHVVIATVQTLKDYLDTEDFQQFGCIMLDECHHVAATTFMEVIGRSKAKYRYGLTASLTRKDSKHFLLRDVFGEVLSNLDYDDVQERVRLPFVTAVYYEGGHKDDDYTIIRNGEEQIDFMDAYKKLSSDPNRNKLILSTIKESVKEAPNNFILVLTKLRDHAAFLAKEIAKFTTCGLLLGGAVTKQAQEYQDRVINLVRDGKIRVVVGTSIADEGLDIVRLNKLVFCIPTTFIEILKQRIGRIARRCEDKGLPEVFDIVDIDSSVFANQWWSRKKSYEKLGILTVDDEEYEKIKYEERKEQEKLSLIIKEVGVKDEK